ncbi:hypothetical protein G6O67_004728 [Ophiocordyceps sinensis]|uniref:Uncharacterized protein n=1 Tax=Ophiocordyceps sinensis TaxID=72228 RepID=A0A8H4PQ10_9HYPO|nr:hypothetical protein G6O67_004728 [Ophiocordyceps sinensis]
MATTGLVRETQEWLRRLLHEPFRGSTTGLVPGLCSPPRACLPRGKMRSKMQASGRPIRLSAPEEDGKTGRGACAKEAKPGFPVSWQSQMKESTGRGDEVKDKMSSLDGTQAKRRRARASKLGRGLGCDASRRLMQTWRRTALTLVATALR